MRAKEQCRFACEAALAFPVKVHVEPYRPSEFYEAVKGLEQIPEGGERCFACYRLRLEQGPQSFAAKEITTTFAPRFPSVRIKTRKSSMKSGWKWQKNTASNGCFPILKRKTAFAEAQSFPILMTCTVRITAAVYFPVRSVWQHKKAHAAYVNPLRKRNLNFNQSFSIKSVCTVKKRPYTISNYTANFCINMGHLQNLQMPHIFP